MSDFPLLTIVAESVSALLMGGIVWGVRQYIALPTTIELAVLVGVGIGVYFSIVLAVSSGVRGRVIPIVRDVVQV